MSPKPPSPPKPRKHRLFIGILLAIVLLGGVASFLISGGKSTRKTSKRAEVISITLPPPPLPPPPPPPTPKNEPPPPDKEEMVEQAPVDEVVPPDAPPEAPSDEALGTNVQGNGPDMGLTRGGGNGGSGNKIGGGRRGGKWDSYAVAVQTTISAALKRNQGTRSTAFSMTVRVWADTSGRITRAQLVGSSGNPAVDQVIKNQVLVGLQLTEPPPSGMPMPINMRITARKSI